MKVELIQYTPNGIHLIARLARATRKNRLLDELELIEVAEKLASVCTGKDRDEKFVKKLIKIGHLGILEHITFTFHISEISRCLTHQLVRHRLASYLQMSNRHAKPESISYVTPESIKQNTKAWMNIRIEC